MARDPLEVLRSRFGYPGFRPGQEQLVRAVLGGRDALGVLPTGGGKSVCYQVPAFLLDGLTLVVTPLVSLMQDQVGRARAVGLAADALSGTQTAKTKRAVAERVRSGVTRLLFVAPERLALPPFRRLLASVRVSLVAVDEAHCISEWGHDFRPSYRRIGGHARRSGTPILALTASATPTVRADIVSSLGLCAPLEVIRSFDRPNLRFGVLPVGARANRSIAAYRVLSPMSGPAIVYAPTRRAVETARDRLASCGLRTDGYHAELPGEERTRVQERFMGGETRVVVATNAFGMGIDKADVRVVMHLQLPTSLEAYYQEAGRAGRDGDPAACVAFHARSDGRLGRAFLDRTHPRRRTLVSAWRVLRRLADRDGLVEVGDPRVAAALRPHRPRVFRPHPHTIDNDVPGWLAGDPAGPLGALERIGAIRRVGDPDAGCVVVRRRLVLTAAGRHRRLGRAKLRAVARYARTRSCRRNAILRYFGEARADACGRCDRCGWRVSSGSGSMLGTLPHTESSP